MKEESESDYLKGRGAQLNTHNPYQKHEYVQEHVEGLDEEFQRAPKREVFLEHPKKIVNKVESPDLPMPYSINPYQGCEHGCIYCYARNSHQYWGFSAGLDFESKLIAKPNAPALLEKKFQSKNWQPETISLSGNTDCYQPLEKELKITRQLLAVFLKYGNPVSIITKNQLVLRDLDILKLLAEQNLVHVYLSITTLDEDLRRKLEPRTATGTNRLKVVETLAQNDIPTGVMTAPIIPGINNQEIPALIKAAAEAGALTVGYTMVRLNGNVAPLFEDWLYKNFPDRAEKVWHQIQSLHGGQVNNNQFGDRMRG
ncbi:MAG TPA: radical SAM protein, partial [Cytophagales bacterium]|nr:radical SAM protein [Cytophagales bacterium]